MQKFYCDEPEIIGLVLRLQAEPRGKIEAAVTIVGDEWVGTVKGLIVPAGRKSGDYREVIIEQMQAHHFKAIRWSRHRKDGKIEWTEFKI